MLILLQRDRVLEASAMPGDWLWRAATRIAARDADMLAANPGLAGLIVAPRYAETAALPRLAACTHATRSLLQ